MRLMIMTRMMIVMAMIAIMVVVVMAVTMTTTMYMVAIMILIAIEALGDADTLPSSLRLSTMLIVDGIMPKSFNILKHKTTPS